MTKNRLEAFGQCMQTRRYSGNSISSYVGVLKVFFQYSGDKAPDEIAYRDIYRFNADFIIKRGYYEKYRSGDYLFPGQKRPQYSTRSIEMILKRAVAGANVQSPFEDLDIQ